MNLGDLQIKILRKKNKDTERLSISTFNLILQEVSRLYRREYVHIVITQMFQVFIRYILFHKTNASYFVRIRDR